MWERIKSLKIHGWPADLWKRYEFGRWHYEVSYRRGENYVTPSGSGQLTQKDAVSVARADASHRDNPYSNPPSGFIPCKAVKITRNRGRVEVRIRK